MKLSGGHRADWPALVQGIIGLNDSLCDHAGGLDLDEDVILTQLRARHLASTYTIGPSITIENECLHRPIRL